MTAKHKKLMSDHHFEDSGRSMVEMLGVLAIMGLLSIGAIRGIQSALISHKVNDILAALNRRAVVWLGNKNLGQTFEQFANDELGYTWSNPKDNGSYIELHVSGIDSRVCAKLSTQPANPLISVNPNCTLFMLSTEPNSRAGCNTSVCMCSNGGVFCNGTCCEKGYFCSSFEHEAGHCIPVSGECTTNQDCDPGKLCKLRGSTTRLTGTCIEPQPISPITLDLNDDGVEETTLYHSPPDRAGLDMSYWAAFNYCAFYGRRMFTIDPNRLNCKGFQAGTTTSTFHCCDQSYEGNPGSCSASDFSDRSASMRALEERLRLFSSVTYWTGTSISDTTAYYIHLGYGRIDGSGSAISKNYGAHRILCE